MTNHINVCHISPGQRTRGGISTVVANYQSFHDWPVKQTFIESHRDGSKSEKIGITVLAFKNVLKSAITQVPDIVQIHVGDFPSVFRKMLICIPMIFRPKVKIIIHLHGAEFMNQFDELGIIKKKIVKSFFKRADLIITLSESWRKDVEQHLDLKRSVVITNAVRVSENIPMSKKLDGQKTFLFLGLIGERKGVFDLLDAAKSLSDDGIPFEVWIGGNGDTARLKSEILAKGLGTQIKYLGWITGAERDLTMQAADVLVLPSYAEGAPMSVIEGMAAGMPIITTSVGALPEIVHHGVNGFLVEPGDKDGLADAMRRIIRDNQLQSAMAKNSYQIARRQFAIEAHCAKMLEQYRRLLTETAAL